MARYKSKPGFDAREWTQKRIHSVLLLLLFVLPLKCQSLKVGLENEILDDPLEYDSSGLVLAFTQEVYEVVIPENSIGKVYAVPNDLNTKMGIALPVQVTNGNKQSISVRFRIKTGDEDNFFKAEAERVGDFVFLLIRTRTNSVNVLNRERRDAYELEIRTRVRDKDNRRLKMVHEATTVVRVRVKDVNDLDPFFQPSSYSFNVPEDTPLHQSVGQVHAEDADKGINGEIYFSLKDPNSPLAVDPVTGVISLTRPLSYAKNPRHTINVVAQDRGAKSRFAMRAPDTAKVQLSVRQVNLHDPSIQVHHLPEVIEQSNADIYAIVRIEDPDEGYHGQVASLEIIEGDPEAHFRIRQPSLEDPNEFNIEVLRLLDREISPYGYNLTLKAIDKGYPPRTAYKEVHVRLADLNDHAPIFHQEIYEIRVNESVPKDTPILRLKATDEDEGANALVSLSIVAGNRDGHFRINPKSGLLYVDKPLDAEAKAAFSLTVTALDHANSGMRKQSSAKVRIYVVDVNDNEPRFKDGFYREVTFEENKPAGSHVYTIEAYDEDTGENGYLSYSIANIDDDTDLNLMPFEIDDFSGVIRSKRLLDYESDQRVWHLKIRASDWGTPYRRQSEMRLTIRLLDINDNRPQFERIGCVGSLDRDLVNPGADIFTLSALDFDAGNIINYRFVSSITDGCFSLDAHKGSLTVMCDLRTLPMTSRTLNVTATDGQHFSDVTPIVLNFKPNQRQQQNQWFLHQNNNAANAGVDFQCRETDVAARLTDLMAKAERNNLRVLTEDQDFHLSSSALPNRFGTNVHQPEIRDLPSEISVLETASVGTKLLKVHGHDRDHGFNGELLYVISNGDYDSVFKIDTLTGDLYIDAALDREKTSDYLLNITVQDQGAPVIKSSSSLLHIIVEDVNDNAPQFIKSTFSFFFPENTPKGTPVVTLNATDPDLGLNGQVTYFLESSHAAQDFSLNPLTGLLTVASALDREAKEFYDLTVKAVDSDPVLPLASYAVVRVRVLDVNDVEPQFTTQTYKFKAREDLPLGTVIGSVEAFDPDLYQGGLLKYSLKHDEDDQFVIDEVSGTLKIKRPLDFETKQIYNLTVQATDEGSPPLTSFAHVRIEVIDVNENLHPPRFETFFVRTAVPENMPLRSLVIQVQASDMDALRNPDSEDARVSYSIRGGDGLGEFYIDAQDGSIKTLAVLDREVKNSYWLTIVAEDHGAVPLASRLDVFIEVLDVNDNVPMTMKPVYSPSVLENSKAWQPILQLEAFDADAADDNEISITFDIIRGNPQSLFSIDKASGLITTTTRMLDREAQAEHVLEILVSDNGNPPLNSTTRVIVNVLDENDNKPEFLERFQKVTLLASSLEEESAESMNLTMKPNDIQNDDNSIFLLDNDPNGNLTSLDANMLEDFDLQVQENDGEWESFKESELTKDHPLFRPLAYDRDQGSNGRLVYSLKSSASGLFQICPSTGIVYSTQALTDPEAEYELLIKATDQGPKGLFSLSRVSLELMSNDRNESKHPPRVLEKSSRVQLYEIDPIGHLVSLVVADDKDGDKLFFTITEGDPQHDFYIHPDKGNLVVASKLDFGRKKFYNLSISITDGKFVTMAYLSIDILEMNTQRPRFEQEVYKAEVSENEAIGFMVTQISTIVETQDDDETAQDVTFSLHAAQNPTSFQFFKIHPDNGQVSLRDSLDMERMQDHVLIVGIKDKSNGMDNFAKLLIHVLDDNDHEPKFMADIIQTRLATNADLGSSVVQVQAYDGDHGLNGELRYSIVHGNKDDTFVIDPVMGNVILGKMLDPLETEFMLMVKATDQSLDDDHKKSATIPVHILVTTGQDVPPKFVQDHFSVEVAEDLNKGSLIVHAEADGNSKLYYRIKDHPEELFKINPSTGHIVNQWLMDFERQDYYNFSVVVSNALGTKNEAFVEVYVLDVNDNRPAFENSTFLGHISEMASIGSLVLKYQLHHHPLVIKATDQDSGVNALLSYEILNAEAKTFFAIDESTGAIRSIATLDYERRQGFEFEVRVSDRGSPRLTCDSTTRVVIAIDDENDSPPKFLPDPQEVVLLLPTFTGVPIAQVQALDQDLGLNNSLKYSILSGNEEEALFKIDPESGWIQMAKEATRVNQGQYHLDLTVTDGKYHDRKLLKINVDKSDNSGLAFAKSRYFASVLENSTKSDVLVIANVLGAELNENLRFSILNLDQSCENLFNIGETSGALKTTGHPFDREVQDKYELVIEVRSEEASRANPRVAHVIVDVEVLDMNDNAPTFVNLPYFAIVQRSKSSRDSAVIKVHAVDVDQGPNGDIYYQLVKGNGELFRVGRKSGLVTLRTDLTNSDYKDKYTLTIAAYDGGTPPFSAEVVVVIKIVDESVPLFDQQLYTTMISEDVELFTPLLAVQANSPTDNDIDDQMGTPNKLIFSIEAGNENDLFHIDSETGMMSNVAHLDYESKRHHQLRVRATDSINGGYSETIVLFEVQDVNDCPPVFEKSLYKVNISEAAAAGSPLVKVSTTDADGPGDNSHVEYSLIRSGNDSKDLSLFNIDAKTGEITLRTYLDRERKSQHSLKVLAIDQGARPLSSIAHVQVTVLDTNDNAPVFEEAEYSVRLSDQAKRGQFVAVVRAIDTDDNVNDVLTYSITDGNANQNFKIQPNSGVISLSNLGDFESTSAYNLNLSVSDGIFSTSAKMRIRLVSANSFTPTFAKDAYQVEYAEGQPEGVRVCGHIKAVDYDRSDSLTYSIQSDNLLQLFSIDSLTGEVWSRHMFDREARKNYEIPIVASDAGGRSGFTTLVVNITDVNDNNPEFELEEYKANVYANLSSGSPIVQVRAHDLDDGRNAQLHYSIYNDNDDVDKHMDLFRIDSANGLISLKKDLNQKEHVNQVYQFFVRAQDQGVPVQLHADVPVEVYIMSQLDRPPRFIKRQGDNHQFYIRENSPVGRVITQLEAKIDGDDSESPLTYKLVSAAYVDQELFQMDEEGRLIISGRLDREEASKHDLTISAETKTSPTLNQYLPMTIQVLDSNDNAPEFHSDPYVVSVSETIGVKTDIVQVKAEDLDFGTNGAVRYKLEERQNGHHPWRSSLFSIDMHSGWIQNLQPLDYENQARHDLVVKAEDGNGLSSSTTVRIHVIDANDNPHQFSQRHFTAAVNEGALPGTVVIQLSTEDADQVATTSVDFFIRDGDTEGKFAIKSNGEIYVSRPVDREKQSVYKLIVAALDGTFVTDAKVTIEILDDNDNPPVCLKSSYSLKISEDTNPGFYLTQIEVSDADEGVNAKQVFELVGEHSEHFDIDQDSGILQTMLPLDREKVPTFRLRAHVQDANMPEWECYSDIVIDILDINDNQPDFSQDVFTASMREDTPLGAIATKIYATDADASPSNKKITYDLLDTSQFNIDSQSGIVRLSKELDREKQALYNLTVRAMDQGLPRLSQVANLIILVLDVNDNPPEFKTRKYFASVKEDALLTDVVRVQATSKDAGVNADITYSIVAGNEARKFDIHSKNGMIQVVNPLDHETSKNYYLTIQAQDGGDPPLSNHATVNITVMDVNDNAPEFAQVSYNAMINEAALSGEKVAIVRANDADQGENGQVLYSIRSGDRQKQFSIDSRQGVISVNSGAALDREMISSYVLEIEAADHGVPVKSSTVLVNIDITDANDNPPVFAQEDYNVYVQEDKSFDFIVARFSVTDADDNPNGSPFTFDIRAGNEDNAFRVVQDGTLRTAAKFNHQIKNQYVLQIRAFDNGTPPLFSDVMVTVNIIEESQYPPIVIPMKVEVKSYLDDFPGALVGRVKANDQDPYDQLTYDLVQADNEAGGGYNIFDIDHSKGTIIALEGLDVGVYTLNISVSDGKFTSYGEAIVTVDLITDDMLDNGVIMRFDFINPEDFVLSYARGFVKIIKTILNVRTSDVVILSVHLSSPSSPMTTTSLHKRPRRDEKRAAAMLASSISNETIDKSSLEVLFVVRKNKNEYLSKDKVHHGLKNKLHSISKQLGLTVIEMQEDECTSDHCQHGRCLDEVLMDETAMVSVITDVLSFVAPKHSHAAKCHCHQGYTGRTCDRILNECAKKPCPPHKLCIPIENSEVGYKCTCPAGMIGELCNVDISTCGGDKCNHIVNPMTFKGDSYAQYELSRSVESHLSVQLGVRTLWTAGVLFEISGQVDYAILEIIQGGKLGFRFNFGSGEGLVMISSMSVSDGHWHFINLERHGNSVKLVIDNKFEAQGSAPGVNDALEATHQLYVGNNKDFNKGFHGCLDGLKVDDIPLPIKIDDDDDVQEAVRVAELKVIKDVAFKCDARLVDPGLCGSQPCLNGGTCLESMDAAGRRSYKCTCNPRFSGAQCQEDSNPCLSNPCLHGAKCVNLNNDYHCECPDNLSGKRCHYGQHCIPNPCLNGGVCEEASHGPICQCRGFTGGNCSIDINECLRQNPCHNGGTCINTLGSFKCQCPTGTIEPYCHILGGGQSSPNEQRDYAFKLEEMVGIIASLFGLVLLVLLWVLCRKFRVVKHSNHRPANTNHSSTLIQNDFDKAENIQMRHPEPLKLNNLENDLYVQRPLISPLPRSGLPAQQETSFNYVDTVRSYGSAADELESLPPTRLTSHDYIQSIQKPMAAVAPSVINDQASMIQSRNLLDFYPAKGKLNNQVDLRSNVSNSPRPSSFKPLKVNLPTVPNPTNPTDSPGLKGATSLSSLQTSVNAEDTPKYFWDSFDLNNANAENEPLETSEVTAHPCDVSASESSHAPTTADEAERARLLMPQQHNPLTNVDPTRDIETLAEDVRIATMPRRQLHKEQELISNADTEDEPPLGAVFPNKPVSTSFEQLLALNDDINFADEDDLESPVNAELPNSYDYHLHLNNYLPTYHMSETSENEEQTPMLDRRSRMMSANANDSFDVSSEFNASIRALPEDMLFKASNSSALPPPRHSNVMQMQQQSSGPAPDDNLCQLEETDDEDLATPTVESKPNLGAKITQV